MLSPDKLILRVQVIECDWMKTILFDSSQTIEGCIRTIAEKLERKIDHGEYGVFIPVYQGHGSPHLGWLDESSSLSSFGFVHRDLIEFRRKVFPISIKLPDESTISASVDGTKTISQMIPSLVRIISIPRIPLAERDQPQYVRLNKDVLLLHLPLPKNCHFILMSHSPLGEEGSMSDDELSSSCSLYLWVPSIRGNLMKKGDKGLVKTWKKRWFDLRADKLFYYKQKGDPDPINYIPLQRCTRINYTEPFDTLTRKVPQCAIQIETATGRIYFLVTETEELRHRWAECLDRWLLLKPFFGPDRPLAAPSSARRASARTASARLVSPGGGASPGSPTPRRHTAAPTSRIKDSIHPTPHGDDGGAPPNNQEMDGAVVEDVPAASTEREVNLLLVDGSIQPLIVDDNVELYDLVYAIAEEVCSVNAHLISAMDQEEARQIELLDHQKCIRDQNIPDDAIFLLKKTGIVDEFVGPDDIYDNHFLYVQLPRLEGTMILRKAGTAIHECVWRQRWVTLRGNRLYYFASASDTTHISFIPLYPAVQVRWSVEHVPPEGEGHSFTISCSGYEAFHMVASSKSEAQRWLTTINRWSSFFEGDGTRDRGGLDVGDEFQGWSDFLRAEPEEHPHTPS